jgi:hypothetical protein
MHRMPDGSLMKGEKHKVAKKPVKKKKKKWVFKHYYIILYIYVIMFK